MADFSKKLLRWRSSVEENAVVFLRNTFPSMWGAERIAVVAPHADDELLGCGALLAVGAVRQVFYPLTMSAVRREEAERLARFFRYEAHFADGDGSLRKDTELLLVPSPRDPHPEHQHALTIAMHLAAMRPGVRVGEYCVAGQAPYAASLEGTAWCASRRALFNEFFPSQKKVGLDERFHAFEGYAKLIGGCSVTVTVREVGFHCWPDAPETEAYLRNKHRHVFGCRVTIHDLYGHDREVEYHDVQKQVQDAFRAVLDDEAQPDHSCETMARAMAISARQHWHKRVTVRVDEDGENWSEVSL